MRTISKETYEPFDVTFDSNKGVHRLKEKVTQYIVECDGCRYAYTVFSSEKAARQKALDRLKSMRERYPDQNWQVYRIRVYEDRIYFKDV